jgi:hypothetical protein
MEDERLGNLAEGVLGLEGRQELALRPPDAADSRLQAFSRRTVGNFRWLLDAFGRQVLGLREELCVRLCLLWFVYGCVCLASRSYLDHLETRRDTRVRHLTEAEFRGLHNLG